MNLRQLTYFVTLAEELRAGLSGLELKFGDAQLSLTASFGVAEIHAQCSTLDHLLSLADQALYEAKERGRNRVVASSTA